MVMADTYAIKLPPSIQDLNQLKTEVVIDNQFVVMRIGEQYAIYPRVRFREWLTDLHEHIVEMELPDD